MEIAKPKYTVVDFRHEWDNNLPYIIAHTSGSTGKPKEIRLLKSDMLASAHATNTMFGIDSTSFLHLPLSAEYIAGKMMIVRAIEAKCALTFESPSLTPLANYNGPLIDLIPIIPAQIEGLLASPALSRIKQIIVGGAPLTSLQEEQLVATGIPSYATYGMTETCSHVAVRRLGANGIYRAMPGVTFTTNPDNTLNIFSNYLSQSPFHTHDCAELLSPTSFRLLGRADNVIISGGKKIHPEQLETQLAPALHGLTFYITSRPSSLWGEEAIIVVEAQLSPSEKQAILAHCTTLTHRHLVPKDIISEPILPRTTSGKIIRQKF